VLCNRRDGPYVDLSNRVADLFLGLKETSDDRPPAMATPKAQLDRFAGTYFSESAADGILLEARDGVLFDVGDDREYRQLGRLTFVSSSAETPRHCAVAQPHTLLSWQRMAASKDSAQADHRVAAWVGNRAIFTRECPRADRQHYRNTLASM
jgi:hypothetical protein